MTNTTKLITKLALAVGLIGSLAVSVATPSLASNNRPAAVYTVNPVHHRGSAPVDDPPGSHFQTQRNNESMGCPC